MSLSNAGFESGDTVWTRSGLAIIAENAGLARTGSWLCSLDSVRSSGPVVNLDSTIEQTITTVPHKQYTPSIYWTPFGVVEEAKIQLFFDNGSGTFDKVAEAEYSDWSGSGYDLLSASSPVSALSDTCRFRVKTSKRSTDGGDTYYVDDAAFDADTSFLRRLQSKLATLVAAISGVNSVYSNPVRVRNISSYPAVQILSKPDRMQSEGPNYAKSDGASFVIWVADRENTPSNVFTVISDIENALTVGTVGMPFVRSVDLTDMRVMQSVGSVEDTVCVINASLEVTYTQFRGVA